MPETRPILVVGAGPTGMTAAMELARLGIPVRIVDQAHQPSTTSRALAVQARTLELFAQRGLARHMLDRGNQGHAATIYSKGHQLGRVDLRRIESPFNFCLLIPQSDTEAILRDELTRLGSAVEFSTTLVAFTQTSAHAQPTGVHAVLRRPDGSLEELDAAFLIATQGAHSSVRDTLNLPFPGKSLQHSYALADLHIDGPIPEDELSIFLPGHGLMAVFPLGHQRFRMIATQPAESAARPGEPSVDDMQQLWNAASHIPATLHGLLWSSHFRINSRMLDHLRSGRILFGGDSAHIHSPAGGQGMNTGIQDMINLGWKLALVYKGLAPESLLDTFEAERLPVIRALVETTEGATDALTADSPFLHSLVMLVAPGALDLSVVQKRAAKMLSQTGTRYQTGPLTGSGTFAGVHTGERFLPPGPADQPQTLSPDRFTLFTSTPFLPELQPWQHLLDLQPASSLPGLGDRHLLVRPDGHLALVTTDPRQLTDYFHSWATPPATPTPSPSHDPV